MSIFEKLKFLFFFFTFYDKVILKSRMEFNCLSIIFSLSLDYNMNMNLNKIKNLNFFHYPYRLLQLYDFRGDIC